MRRNLYFFLFLLSLPLFPEIINREQVINMAQNYLNVVWLPNKDRCEELYPPFNSFPPFGIGNTYTGEAYVWGGFDRFGGNEQFGNGSWINKGLTFPERILFPFCPGGYNTGPYGSPTAPTNLAGIDCSGYVTRCLGIETSFHPYNTMSLWSSGIALVIDYSELKPGDILDNPGDHVVLYASGELVGNWHIYESSPPIVTFGSFLYNSYNYIPLSIFPQFSNPTPAAGEVVDDVQTLDICLEIKVSGTLVPGGVSMFINGDRVSNPNLHNQGDNTWLQ